MAKTAKHAEAVNRAALETADVVQARVLKKGDGLISNGVHHPGAGDEFYEFGEIVGLPRVVALELEERGYVEIQPDKKAAA